ncbi:MAG: hydantoinase/oxoprolinase family protein, partial [Deltaproteobacteria bacterium]|nr:hydantoinase/oxoprolinase family protein [Deltaproteobacteria bacterium]
ITEDAIILDIGGTTTDIAIFADGAPLLEKDGVTFDGRATLVRAITSKSIGIGGDSTITTTSDGAINVGPGRRGPALAFDGPQATLIDACNFKNLCRLGRPEKSIAGINRLAATLALSGAEVANRAIGFALDNIYRATALFLAEINQKPVYTVAEVLHGKTVKPKQLHIMGGPAAILAPLLGETFALPTLVPEHYAVANAIGAALTRPTMEINLFADTAKKEMLIPNLGLREAVGSGYTLTEARRDGVARLGRFLKQNGHPELEEQDISITEAETFNMIDDYTAGGSRSIRVSCQLRPGLDPAWLKEVGNHAD